MVTVCDVYVTSTAIDPTLRDPPAPGNDDIPHPLQKPSHSGQFPSRCAKTCMNRFACSPSMTR